MMKKLYKIASIRQVIGLFALGMALPAFAVDTIQFTGRVVDESCVVDTATSGDTSGGLTVALGDVPKSTITASGAKSSDTPFTISLTGCPASDAQISLKLTGDSDATGNGKLLKVVAGTGTVATGVGIAVFDDTGTQLDFTSGSANSPTKPTDTSGNVTFDFTANIMNDGGTLVAGDAYSSATVTVNYQ